LIEQAGFKGNALETLAFIKIKHWFLNYGNATGQEILNVSKNIQETIYKIFGIHIETEVNVI
jgi:UDP-N-acetylmuramate dehydrogenase